MMDSQEKALEKGQNEVIKEEEVNAQAVETPADETASQVETKEEQPQKVYASKAEILERVREIAHGDETPQKEEVDYLKTAFYKLHIAEREAHIKAFIDGGGDPNQYQIVPDSIEEAFKAEMGIIKEKRAKLFKEQEAEKQDNLIKKLGIIDKIKSMITTPEYREIGPVAKEQREEIWNRFKAASTVINKRHQQHFEGIRAREEENLARKTELCEKVEAIAAEENKGSGDWEKHTKQIIDLQAEWKTIGFAPQKMNVKIFERFRAACDDFFGRKAEYFKGLKDTFKENADKKRALIEKAKALQDSTEWRATGDKLIALQKEWKTIGIVPKKLGDQLWEEFLGACNKFFEARKAAGVGQHSEEYANLEKKRDVIAKLKNIAEEAGENIQEKVQSLVEEYNAIGHVPFKEKDKIYEEYHAVLDKLYKDLNISVAKRRLNNFKQNLKQVAERGENALDNERARLFRQYEAIKQEVQTYENNLGFLNASSKKGNSLIDEMNRKVQKLKDDMNLVREKIKAIDAQNE